VDAQSTGQTDEQAVTNRTAIFAKSVYKQRPLPDESDEKGCQNNELKR